MKSFYKFISLFAMLLSLVGCTAKQDNVVKINIGAEPQTLDPRKARDLQSMTIAKMFFEGLTRINEEDKPELAIAEKVDVTEEGKVYTFTLRSAKWTNGEAVTAHDFVYAWTKTLEPPFSSRSSFSALCC
jgi:ABC-type oligopeptide transport system substrate-binding subunit